MPKLKDNSYLVGAKFNRLTITEVYRTETKPRIWFATTLCDCGTTKPVDLHAITTNHTKSCGCWKAETMTDNLPIGRHGLCTHPLYDIWDGMKDRCHKKTTASYKRYGARGISVCDKWRQDFVPFYDWAITNGYAKGLQIDRRNNDGNYEPDNCRFVTPKENARNRGNNRIVTIAGEAKTITEWAEISGIKKTTFFKRINKLKNDTLEKMP